jgi:hypothetical protein
MTPSPSRGAERSKPMVMVLTVMSQTLSVRMRKATNAAANAIQDGMPMNKAAVWLRSEACSKR